MDPDSEVPVVPSALASPTRGRSPEVVRHDRALPPPRGRKGLRHDVPLPLSQTPLHRFNYYLALFAVIIMAIYSWRILKWKAEYGGWVNLVLDKRPTAAPHPQDASTYATPNANAGFRNANPNREHASAGRTSVEEKIEELAAALGMPSSGLSAAIASAVREYVPPASLSSVATREPSGTAVRYLVDPDAASSQETGAIEGKGGALKNMVEAAVGLDGPPNDIGV